MRGRDGEQSLLDQLLCCLSDRESYKLEEALQAIEFISLDFSQYRPTMKGGTHKLKRHFLFMSKYTFENNCI